MASKKVSDLQYAESKHQYTDPRDKERKVSVTTVVGMLDTGDKLGAGAGAAVKLTKEGLNYREVWKGKAELGSRVHGYAQLWMEGRSAEVPGDEWGYMDAFGKFCADYTPEWLEVERAVVSAAGYGGRFDMIGELHGEGFCLCDIKTGKAYKPELTLQLAAYRYADGMVVYDEDGMAVSLEPMPHIDLCAGLYLHEDGSYDFVPVPADEVAFRAFERLLQVKHWLRDFPK